MLGFGIAISTNIKNRGKYLIFMKMDESWHSVYETNAEKDLPEYEMSCWTKDDFDELVIATKAILRDIKGKNIKTALDVGCGPGYYCKYLHDIGYEVTGVDYSEKTLQVAKKKYPYLNFMQADGYALPFPDQGFDMVISIGALQCVYDYKKFLTESARVAKQALIISTLYRRKNQPTRRSLWTSS